MQLPREQMVVFVCLSWKPSYDLAPHSQDLKPGFPAHQAWAPTSTQSCFCHLPPQSALRKGDPFMGEQWSED